jgi:hypothetical protein
VEKEREKFVAPMRLLRREFRKFERLHAECQEREARQVVETGCLRIRLHDEAVKSLAPNVCACIKGVIVVALSQKLAAKL